jgi:AcrR family transcriptional regulator
MDGPNANLRTEPKQVRALARIEQILDAAALVFTEFGYDSATTNEIARRADTSIGALYRFFPDKKSIFVALAERYLKKASSLVAEEALPILSLNSDGLARFFVELCDRFIASEPAFAAVFVYADGSPELKDIDRQMKRRASTVAAKILAQRNKTLSPSECEMVARVCIEISAAYFRLSLSEPEMPAAKRRAAFEDLIGAYLKKYVEND